MMLIGLCRLGRDSELRYLQDGTPVLGLALAYNYGKKDDKGNRPTQWIDASMFGERAQKLQSYLVKGQQINAVIEDVRIEQFTRRDNTVGNALRGRIVTVEFAGSAPNEKTTSTPTQAGASGGSKPAGAAPAGNFSDPMDDVPF